RGPGPGDRLVGPQFRHRQLPGDVVSGPLRDAGWEGHLVAERLTHESNRRLAYECRMSGKERTMYTDSLTTLAGRVSRKDNPAAVEMRSELEYRLVFMVRRLMRTRIGASPLDRRILAEV